MRRHAGPISAKRVKNLLAKSHQSRMAIEFLDAVACGLSIIVAALERERGLGRAERAACQQAVHGKMHARRDKTGMENAFDRPTRGDRKWPDKRACHIPAKDGRPMQLDQVRTKLDPAAPRVDPSRARKRIFIRRRRAQAKRRSPLGKLVSRVPELAREQGTGFGVRWGCENCGTSGATSGF